MFATKTMHILFSPTPFIKGAYFGAPNCITAEKFGLFAGYPRAVQAKSKNNTYLS